MAEESVVAPEYGFWYIMIVGVLFQTTDVRFLHA